MVKRFRGRPNWTMAEIVREYKSRIGTHKYEADRNYQLAHECMGSENPNLAKRYALKAKEDCNVIIKYSLIKEERSKYWKMRAKLLKIIKLESSTNEVQTSEDA